MSDSPTDHDIRALIATAEDYYDVADSEANADLCEIVAATLTWVLGEADEPSLPEPEWCTRCDGTGGWARPVEDADGRVLDDDIECPRCLGSRVEP